jgi:CO/xanthine dehydrogenase Mo-binding subunit
MPEGSIKDGIGASVRRKEDKRFLTGSGRYTADINRPGQLHVHFIRSVHAHANIKAIRTEAAAAADGVAGLSRIATARQPMNRRIRFWRMARYAMLAIMLLR